MTATRCACTSAASRSRARPRSAPSCAGSGPLLMGNDGSKRLMAGRMDQAVFAARAFTASEMSALTCLRRAPAIAGTPAVSAPTPTGVPASFDIAHHQQRHARRVRRPTSSSRRTTSTRGSASSRASRSSRCRRATTGHIADDRDRERRRGFGDVPDPVLRVPDQQPDAAVAARSAAWTSSCVASGCRVSTPRELMITNLGVVDNIRAVRRRRLVVQAPDGGDGADAGGRAGDGRGRC